MEAFFKALVAIDEAARNARPPTLKGSAKDRLLFRYDPALLAHTSVEPHEFPSGICMVTKKSPATYKKAVETCAGIVAREQNWDRRLYTADEYVRTEYKRPEDVATDARLRAFLWFSGKPGSCKVFGAAAFRVLRKDPSLWNLQWAWLLPDQRRKGHLTVAWPFFKSMFGLFVVEKPWSPAMQVAN